MDDQAEIRQVDAARRDVGGDADAGAAVAQRLQGAVALGLGQLARQRHGGEAALRQAAVQPGDRARVRQKTSAPRASKKRSTLTTACSVSCGAISSAR